MSRIITLSLLVALLWSVPAEAADELTAEVVGIMVTKKDPASKYKSSYVLGLRPGLSVFVRIATKGKDILKIDSDASALGTFQTDTGTKLMPTKRQFGRPGWLRSSLVARDAKSVSVTLATDTMPKAGAVAVVLKGSLAVVCTGEIKSTEIKDVAAVKGTEIKGGPVPLTISEFKESKYQKGKYQLTLQSGQSLDAIKTITFVGPDGKDIKATSGGSMKMGFGGKYTYSKSFYLEGNPPKLTLKIDSYTDLKTVKVPLDVKVGLGL